MPLQESGEMYLETIFILSQKSSFVRAIDVGEYMGYSKPSVSRALGLLKEGQYVTVGKEGDIKLTNAGMEIASKIYERHMVMSEFFKKIGVSEKTAVDDACKVEHYLSDETFNALKSFLNGLI